MVTSLHHHLGDLKVHRMIRLIPYILLINLLVQVLTINVKMANASQEVNMGTTILALKYRDGVVVGADSRTSAGGYVSNRYATKIDFVLEKNLDISAIPPTDLQLESPLYKPTAITTTNVSTKATSFEALSSTCCVCRSGSAADTQNLVDAVRHQILKRKIINSSQSSISNIAHMIRSRVIGEGGGGLMASLICAGYDHVLRQGVVYSIDIGGTIMEHDVWTSSGSGSSYVLGFIDANIPTRTNSAESAYDNCSSSLLGEDEAVEFVAKAIELAMDRDGSSGGCIRIFVIDKDGKRGIVRMPKASTLDSNSRSNSWKSLANFAPPKRTR